MNDVAAERAIRCPREVSRLSEQERVSYFEEEVVLWHRNLQHAFDELEDFCDVETTARIKILTGATGVGKTTIAERLYARIWKQLEIQLKSDLITIPAILFEPEAPEDTEFDWKSLYEDVLTLLLEPGMEATLPLTLRTIAEREVISLKTEFRSRQPSKRDLRRRLRGALRKRNTRFVILDEAVDVIVGGGDRAKILRYANVIKSLVNSLRTRIIIVGSYEALSFSNASSQLARRSDDVLHIPRYRDTQEDIEEFYGIYCDLVEYLPLNEPIDLSMHAEWFFNESFGVIGILKKLLVKVLRLLIKDKEKFKPEWLARCALQKPYKDAIQAELKVGESIFPGDAPHPAAAPAAATKGKRPGRGLWRPGGERDPSRQ
jgi:hypothetical protein